MSDNRYLRYFQSPQSRSDGIKAQAFANARLVIPFSDISQKDIERVGTKNASLGEMYNTLSREGVRVPGGFAITTDAYRYFLYHNRLAHKVSKALAGLDPGDLGRVSRIGQKIRGWLLHGDIPVRLESQVTAAYRLLESRYGRGTAVAVRGSTTLRYVSGISGSSQQDSLMDVVGESALLNAFRAVFASLFSDRAIVQRLNSGVDAMAVDISVGVQKMVHAAGAASGIMTTLDPETGFRDVVFIASSSGFGDSSQSGQLDPDEFYVHKPALEAGGDAIIKREIGGVPGSQDCLIDQGYGYLPSERMRDRIRFSLDNSEVLALARLAVTIENHYSKLYGKPRPMEIEWAKDGESGDLFIVQARPETAQAQREGRLQTWFTLTEPGWIITSGRGVGNKIVTGAARVINHPSHMNRLRDGEVLITFSTDETWDAVLHRASAIITERGGRSGHTARFSRTRGIPAIVGAANATRLVRNGAEVTLSCRDRDDGFVYEGALDFASHELDFSKLVQPETGLDLTIANPNHAFDYYNLPVRGVGLVKLEYIIWHNIGVHPRALLQIEQTDSGLQQDISRISQAYGGRREFYIQRLAEGIAMVAASFHPKPVTVRFSDFKSDEFAALKGGELFEENDANPIIGFRGAARFLSDEFRESFQLECAAIRHVRDEMGFTNTHLLIPFVRTLEESRDILALMAENGLKRGQNGLRVLLMCETPANVLLAEAFLQDYDGFMLGMGDLSQLTVGFDSESRKVKRYDHDNEAVLKLISMAVAQCRKQGKFIGVCGLERESSQELIDWLVDQGVDSISVEPQDYAETIEAILKAESRVGRLDPVPKLRA